MHYIYVLEDPRKPGIIRYVGKTSGELRYRLQGHLRDLKVCHHRSNWIKSLLKDGVRPTIRAIFQWDDPNVNWQLIEINFIRELRELGHPLTNKHPGGNGTNFPTQETRVKMGKANIGKKPSAETKAKRLATRRENGLTGSSPEAIAKRVATRRSKDNYVHPPEQDEAQRQRMTGSKQSPETIAKRLKTRKANGKPYPKEAVERRAEKRRGVPQTPEQREKNRLSHIGSKQSPETVAKRNAKLTGVPKSEAHKAALRKAWIKRKAAKNINT